MPPIADPEKIISIFDALFLEAEQKNECMALLESISEKSKVDYDLLRYRYQIFKKLSKLVKNKDDLRKLICAHDAILKAITIISEEDITGYHHYYSLKDLERWRKIAGNTDDFLKIIHSKIPETTAEILSKRK